MKKQVLYVTRPSLLEYGEDFLKVSNYKRAMRTDNCSYLTFPIILLMVKMTSLNEYEFVFKPSRRSIQSRVMPHQRSSAEDDVDLPTLKRDLGEANQKLHETIEKMNTIKAERPLKPEEIWEVHDASAEVSQIQRKIVRAEKKNKEWKPIHQKDLDIKVAWMGTTYYFFSTWTQSEAIPTVC